MFSPVVGRAFALLYISIMIGDDDMSAYERLFGAIKFEVLIPGELALFMFAFTIVGHKVAKVESHLRSAIILDYVAPNGKFTGQYICACLEDFVGKSLDRRVDEQLSQLELHRMEVLKRPSDADLVPLK